MGCRLQNSLLLYDTQHPIIVPWKCNANMYVVFASAILHKQLRLKRASSQNHSRATDGQFTSEPYATVQSIQENWRRQRWPSNTEDEIETIAYANERLHGAVHLPRHTRYTSRAGQRFDSRCIYGSISSYAATVSAHDMRRVSQNWNVETIAGQVRAT